MKAIDLYKFIHENNIEFHWQDNDGEPDVLIFPHTFIVERFAKLLPATTFDDSGIECRLMNGYFAFWMREICERFDIDLAEIFGAAESNKP